MRFPCKWNFLPTTTIFCCRRLMSKESVEPLPIPECNQTISLSWESPRQILTSPKYPGQYPDNIECHYYVIAPIGQRIVLEFSDFILEDSLSCEYDILTLIDEDRQWYRCGNWESKIKLLRYVSSKNYMSMIFTTDYSHSFKGFRIEIFIYVEKPEQSILCDNEVFQLRGKYCYLVVNYLEATWATARQICSESKSKLAVVENAEQVPILDDLVRSTYGYLSGTIYWVGASASAGDTTWKWIDGTKVNSKSKCVYDNFYQLFQK
ncbi:protocadherin Fat 1 [Trichonephila inaurata madagascariensis]|uniref:Protocadherin Fat 1 n=1 Tax=Trichonephila inaurata madagascariensis TaxID=2747483 RepID=A0A8X6WUV4_9ARAC|nr:protocadherin Fat 1 [Trichonephila inaurata madagascariensis]